jgi:thiol-disulfide isomerase/thioredoxin
MLSRISLTSALAFAIPILLVLLVVAVLARPSKSSPAVPASDAMPEAPTAGAERNNMASEPIASPPQATATSSSSPSTGSPSTGSGTGTGQALASRPSGPIAPDFDGGGAWINSAPLRLADLSSQGKIVLVDFWTYGCYNCSNTLPYMKQWWEKYKDQGLVIVGVHTPEFESEHVLANVEDAVQRQGIGWPVVQDNDYTIWRAYDNNYWPRFYLIDERGQIIYDHIGEGAYDETDRQIAAALAAAKGQ